MAVGARERVGLVTARGVSASRGARLADCVATLPEGAVRCTPSTERSCSDRKVRTDRSGMEGPFGRECGFAARIAASVLGVINRFVFGAAVRSVGGVCVLGTEWRGSAIPPGGTRAKVQPACSEMGRAALLEPMERRSRWNARGSMSERDSAQQEDGVNLRDTVVTRQWQRCAAGVA